jgi:hypothetical protein
MCNAAEFAFERLLSHANIKSVKFDSLTLIKIAKQHEIGVRRIKLALPFLKKEYGYSVREVDGRYITKIKWADVPATVILDYVFGLDQVFNWRGYHIGIDVTANPETVYDKQGKLAGLQALWRAIGVDKTSVFWVNIPEDRPAEMRVDALVSAIRKIVKAEGEQVVELGL